ncbi:MAG: hypothetical protein WCJ09_24085, partial [Planctomycetota bacterium]
MSPVSQRPVTGRGFSLQRACILAMIASGLAIPYCIAPVFQMLEQLKRLEQQFYSQQELRTASPDSAQSVQLTAREGTFAADTENASAHALNDINGKAEAILTKMNWSVSAVYGCYTIQALLYLPLLISVFRSTTSRDLVPRIAALAMIPCVMLFAAFSTDFVPEELTQFKLPVILSYPYLTLLVIFLASRAGNPQIPRLPFGLLAFVPLVILSVRYSQPLIPVSLVAQLGVCVA